jgi:hypothetical protein
VSGKDYFLRERAMEIMEAEDTLYSGEARSPEHIRQLKLIITGDELEADKAHSEAVLAISKMRGEGSGEV